MLKTIVWTIFYCIGMLCTVIPLWIYHLCRLLFKQSVADRFGYIVTRIWARSTVLSTGTHVTVKGWDNLTSARNVCFVSNHQGQFDIPLLMGWLDRPVGFIAKKELKKIPVLSGWMRAIHSAFLDRKSPRAAVASIAEAAQTIRNGHAVVIFPEGTRSKTGALGEFKAGSMKLAYNSDAVIQPVSISGTRKIFEVSGRIEPSQVTLTIHPFITPGDALYQDKQQLLEHLQSIIGSAVDYEFTR